MNSQKTNTSSWIIAIATVSLWLFLHTYIAVNRSVWGDEMVRYAQAQLPFFQGIQEIFREPSPFSLGEHILTTLSHRVFSSILPIELWLRLPGLFWGALTILLACSLEIHLLPLAIFLSVALSMFATENRQYASLFFAGGLSYAMLYDEKFFSKKIGKIRLSLLLPFSLIFTHIYGICFLGFSSFLRKKWLYAFLAFIHVFILLKQYHLRPVLSEYPPHIFEIFKQTFGTLGNPHKASYLIFPLFILGIFSIFCIRFTKGLSIFALLFVTIIAPLSATIVSKFAFLPRQLLGGAFATVALSILGANYLIKLFKLKNNWVKKVFFSIFFLTCFINPWIQSVMMRVPPFPNQPFHRFKDIALNLANEHSQSNKPFNLLFVDGCNDANFILYLNQAIGATPSIHESIHHGLNSNLNLAKYCWTKTTNPFCLYITKGNKFCGTDETVFDSNSVVSSFINDYKINVVVYSNTKHPTTEYEHNPSFIRSW